jgi:GAF domain-containing protein
MRFSRLAILDGKLVTIINSLALVLTSIGFLWLLWPVLTYREDTDDMPFRAGLMEQARVLETLVDSELEKARQEASSLADWASDIFTNPESYRLPVQPGEYDYDEATGTYGSVRNDGTSVVLLSGSSTLTPQILREIRLSEYLTPAFKALVGRQPAYSHVTLYTTDSLVRSYPWFDFKARIAAGSVKRNFAVTGFSFFSGAAGLRNPKKQGTCDLATEDLRSNRMQWVCAAPFFAGDAFRGVVALGMDPVKLAHPVFSRMPSAEMLAVLISREGFLLGMNRDLGQLVNSSKDLALASLRNLNLPEAGALEFALKHVRSGQTYFGHQAGFYVAARANIGLPVASVVLLPEASAARVAGGHSLTSVARWPLMGLMVGAILLLGFNICWVRQAERQHHESVNGLAASLTALSDLNLGSALGRCAPTLTEAPITHGPEDTPRLVMAATERDSGMGSPGDVERQVALCSYQLELMASFEAGTSLNRNLSRLSESLAAIFGVRQVFLLSYSPAECLLHAPSLNSVEPAIVWKEGTLFDKIVHSRLTVLSNTLDLNAEEQRALSSAIHQNYLLTPLLVDGNLIGAVLLSDRQTGFSEKEQELIVSLRNLLSIMLRNIYQSDVLCRLNASRRAHSQKLARATEPILDNIRRGVQAIYARLGRLTPYYKHHCEIILFEIGKLYEMVREVEQSEPDVEPIPTEPDALLER